MRIDTLTYALELTKKFLGECYDETHDSYLMKLLEDSAGCDTSNPSIILYRPWYAAAFFLKSVLPRGGIIKASGTDGVEWESIDNQITRLLELQKAADCGIGCITECNSADALLNSELHVFSGFMI